MVGAGWNDEMLPVRRNFVFKGINMSLTESKEAELHLFSKLPCQNWIMSVEGRENEWVSLIMTNWQRQHPAPTELNGKTRVDTKAVRYIRVNTSAT